MATRPAQLPNGSGLAVTRGKTSRVTKIHIHSVCGIGGIDFRERGIARQSPSVIVFLALRYSKGVRGPRKLELR